ncbi:MAG: hypothetical protein COB12_06305 [Flavobacterium sp.]|nr:MAG: hypothetical protein COB12_06305 [Flavobacterium sp.]
MSRTYLTIALLFSITIVFGQNSISEAFSKSYQSEYNKEYKNAISEIDHIYSSDSYEINLRLGWLYYSNGDHVKSKNYYANAIKIEPKSIEAKLGIAYTIGALENWDELIILYNDILQIDPYNYTVNLRMATIYYYRKDFTKAASYGEKISKLYPFDYSYNLILGKINLSLGNIIHAKEHLNSALLYNPSSLEVLELLKAL